ncbi:MAG: tetratricopeptide repeat protein [Leptolyngbya sp. SIO4C1]|nr:tetratricopeptide repeat protein [Leptolyngbya sp. SIO4C1]
MTLQLPLWYRRQAAQLAYRRGSSYAQQTNYAQAVDAFTQALSAHSQPAEVYVRRGLSYWKLGQTAAAIADFEAALAIDPQQAKAYGNRGLLRYEQGDEAGALADWAQALTYAPNYAEIYYSRALVAINQGDDAAALADLDQAIELQPNRAEAYFHRGNLRSRQGDQPGAIADWELAICNDFTFEEAKAKLQALLVSSRQTALAEPLQAALPNFTVQAKQVGQCLEITLQREVGVGVGYFTLHHQIREVLMPLQRPGITQFKLVGYVVNPKCPGWTKQEWSKTYELYVGQPCPPSNWQIALSTLVTFPPMGVTALIYAAQVKAFYKQGNYPEAVQASKTVKRLCVTGTGILCAIAMIPFSYVAVTSIQSEASPPQRTARVIDYTFEDTHIE